jgi:hypothetical protein
VCWHIPEDAKNFQPKSVLPHGFDIIIIIIIIVDFWIYLAKTLFPLRTLSVLGKVTRLIIILCKLHIVHLGYVSFVP